MTRDLHSIDGMKSSAKRDLLARLLRERAAGSGETFDLSLGQEALWFLNEFAPGNFAYNVAFCARLRSDVDRERLEGSLLRLLERHPMLRCTFAQSPQGLRQRIGPVPIRCLDVIDAAAWSEEELTARVRETYRLPFDLTAGPVFRAALFSRLRTDHVLLLVAHHIAIDAWSLGHLLTELATLYEKGPAASLSSPRGSYAGFVKWQREMLGSVEGSEAWEYWRSRLEGLPPAIDLPADRTRPSLQGYRGASHHFELPGPLCARLRNLARSENATPFMVLAAAFHALLHRYTGAPAVPIGTPLAGRSRQEFEDVVGYFVNPVVLRAPVGPATTFRQHVAEIREALIGAQRHGDFPFLELVKRLQPVRDRSRTPVFQVMLNLVKAAQIGVAGDVAHPGGQGTLKLGPLALEAFPLDQQEGQFDLSLAILDTGGCMPATLKYSTDLFDSARIERMADHMRTLLVAAVADPDRTISTMPLLTSREEQVILVDWNRTDGNYSIDATLHKLVEDQVDRTPDAPAIVSEEGEVTYGDLDVRANRIAHRLRKLGVGTETLVGVCIDRSSDLVAAMLGVLKAGAAYVPIDPSLPRDRIAYMVDDARIAVLLTERRVEKDIPPTESAVVVLDADSAIDAEESVRPKCRATPESLAYVIYTSGSTGRPKGAMIHHRAIVNHLLWMQRTWPLCADDVVLQKTSTSFDPSIWEIWGPLLSGARVVMAPPGTQGDPEYLVGAMMRHGVTHLRLVPSVLELVAREPGFERCTSLRRLFVGGEALSRALVERVWDRIDVEVVNLYGPTEATIVSVAWVAERGQGPFPPMVPIGRPITNLRAYVLDGMMQPAPVGVPGELHLGGAGVGRGYLRRPDLTEERFLPDPFVPGGTLYKTGDVCRLRADGVIEFLGRNDHQVKIRGCRVELGEVEAVLAEHATVGKAAVVPREVAQGEVCLSAYLAPRSRAMPDPVELRAFLRNRLPEYMVPSYFAVLSSLPLNSSGKVDRKALPLDKPDGVRSEEYEAPRTATEETLARIFAEVLKVERAGIRDDFFALGGHSLLATQLLSRVRAAFGLALPVRALFDARTIAGLAKTVDARLWVTMGAKAAGKATGAPREELEL